MSVSPCSLVPTPLQHSHFGVFCRYYYNTHRLLYYAIYGGLIVNLSPGESPLLIFVISRNCATIFTGQDTGHDRRSTHTNKNSHRPVVDRRVCPVCNKVQVYVNIFTYATFQVNISIYLFPFIVCVCHETVTGGWVAGEDAISIHTTPT